MLIIAFDFGTKNIGVAVGQKITQTASGLCSIKVKKNHLHFLKIQSIILEWKPKIIIVGLPLQLDGKSQKITKKAKKFSILLNKNFNIPVKMHDERLSTVEAKSILFQNGGIKKLTKEKINSTSAVLILESWIRKKNFF